MITSACPSCGTIAAREPYDIGSGPELSCPDCEWCWGAEGQPLNPADVTWSGITPAGEPIRVIDTGDAP